MVEAFNEQVNLSTVTADAKTKYMLGDDLESTLIMWRNYDPDMDYDSIIGSTVDMFRATAPNLTEMVMVSLIKKLNWHFDNEESYSYAISQLNILLSSAKIHASISKTTERSTSKSHDIRKN